MGSKNRAGVGRGDDEGDVGVGEDIVGGVVGVVGGVIV